MSELVEQLREGTFQIGLHEDNHTEMFDVSGADDLMFEAAAHIEAQEAEIGRLTAENTTMRATLNLIARRKGAWQQPARAALSPVLVEDGEVGK